MIPAGRVPSRVRDGADRGVAARWYSSRHTGAGGRMRRVLLLLVLVLVLVAFAAWSAAASATSTRRASRATHSSAVDVGGIEGLLTVQQQQALRARIAGPGSDEKAVQFALLGRGASAPEKGGARPWSSSFTLLAGSREDLARGVPATQLTRVSIISFVDGSVVAELLSPLKPGQEAFSTRRFKISAAGEVDSLEAGSGVASTLSAEPTGSSGVTAARERQASEDQVQRAGLIARCTINAYAPQLLFY